MELVRPIKTRWTPILVLGKEIVCPWTINFSESYNETMRDADSPVPADDSHEASPVPEAPGAQPPSPVVSSVNVEAAQAALGVAGALVQDPFQHFSQEVTDAYSSFGPYFRVNRKSVCDKLRMHLFPFNVRRWGRGCPKGTEAIPVNNSNLPELYTPVVFSFIFLLEACVIMGYNDRFAYKVIRVIAYQLFGYIGLAVCGVKIAFASPRRGRSYSLLSLAADLGTISVYLSLCVLMAWHRVVEGIVVVYCAVAVWIWTVRTLTPREKTQKENPTLKSNIGLALIALIHTCVLFFLVRKLR
jgi:hypothetical protein